MKVIYIYSSLAIWGGLERVLVNKMNYLVSQYGYDVSIITSEQGIHPIPYQMDSRIKHYDLGIRFHQQYQYGGFQRWKIRRQFYRMYEQALRQHLTMLQPDVLVCTTSHTIPLLLKVKGHIPLVVESHVNFLHKESLPQQLLTLYNNYRAGKADAVVTLTEGDAKKWQCVSKRVHVIPNIVQLNDTNSYSDVMQKRVIFVGRLVPQKGIPSLLKIWQIVHQTFPDWRLDIYGEGEMSIPSGCQVNIYPPTLNIMDEYRHSSVLVLTSTYEPFGLVMPEAMSCGVPVVAFDCPYGPSSILTDGEDGFLIPRGNIRLFAERMMQLMADTELRIKMGQAGIRSSQRFTAEKIMPIWDNFFRNLIRNQ